MTDTSLAKPSCVFEAMAKVTQGVIAKNTVEVTCLEKTGRKYVYRYSHPERDLVEMAVANAMNRIDPMRSPSRGCLFELYGSWHCDITYWGL